jgi:glyoxylase-like metal-dependent hydrolase (beta-lactamase superfamily II)
MSLLTAQDNGLEIYQLLAGRDFCKRKKNGQPRSGIFQLAAGMNNYVYCVHDKRSNKAMLIDPCWDIDGIFDTLSTLGIDNIETCAYTHHHFDHAGGYIPKAYTGGKGVIIPGVKEVLERESVTSVCAGELDVEKIVSQCKVNNIRPLVDGSSVWETDNITVVAWHTPGHTAGSMTFIASSNKKSTKNASSLPPPVVITGDTLFIGSCGRYDLPDSNVRHLLMSLEKLSTLPSNAIVCPGHNYAMPTKTTIGQEKRTNQMMKQAMDVGPQLREQQLQQKQNGVHVQKNNIEKNNTTCSTSHDRRISLTSFVSLPDYIGVARDVLKSHVQWEAVHKLLRCEDCSSTTTTHFTLRNNQYEPSESLL